MPNGEHPQQATESRRNTDKYLSYLRELGAMAILAMVLYGVWDIMKVEGKLAIAAIIENTSAVESLKDVNDKILDHLKKLEVKGNVYRSNLGAYGPPYYGRPTGDTE